MRCGRVVAYKLGAITKANTHDGAHRRGAARELVESKEQPLNRATEQQHDAGNIAGVPCVRIACARNYQKSLTHTSQSELTLFSVTFVYFFSFSLLFGNKFGCRNE